MDHSPFLVEPFEFDGHDDELDQEDERRQSHKPPRATRRSARRPPHRPIHAALHPFALSSPCVCPVHGTEFVRWVQSSLNKLAGTSLQVSGVMGASTRQALRQFQRGHHLPDDGIAGPDTVQAVRDALRPGSAAPSAGAASELAGESDAFETLDLEAPAGAVAAPATSIAALEAMNCQLLCAASLTYQTSSDDPSMYEGLAARAGFAVAKVNGARRIQVQVITGTHPIDQCLVGAVGKGDVVLAFRGTVSTSGPDWLNDVEAVLVPFARVPGVRIHKGFRDSLESFYGRGLVAAIKSRLGMGGRLYITGHSKGGALAHLAALLLRTRHPDIPLGGVISFEAPRSGDASFVTAYQAAGIIALRYEFQNDIAPHLPPTGLFAKGLDALLLTNPILAASLKGWYRKAALNLDYQHVGALRFIDWNGNVVGDDPKLEAQRVLNLTKQLAIVASGGAALVLPQIAKWHAIGCGPLPTDTSGTWRALCKSQSCPAPT